MLVNAAHNHSAPSLSRGSSVAGLEDAPAFARYVESCRTWSPVRSTPPGADRGRRGSVGTRPRGRRHVNRVLPERAVDDTCRCSRSTRRRLPLAVVASFACHPTLIGGESLLWNADFPGPLRDAVEPPGPAPSASSSRAAAATSPAGTTGSGTARRAAHAYERATISAEAIGAAALETLGESRRQPIVELAASVAPLELRRRRIPWA